tara:strand:+ start:2080 stop:3321 length:1242 start_codon:yes stop_codon:yes gene_type:complete
MKKNNLLLLMTTSTYRAGAYIDASEKLSINPIIGTDQPDILGHLNPGSSITLDYSKNNLSQQKIIQHIEKFPIKGILAIDEETLILGSMVANSLGLICHSVESVSATRSKYELRKILSEEGLRNPEFKLISSEENPDLISKSISFPCVMKPTFLSGSRGVIRANNKEEFNAAYLRIKNILDEPEVLIRGKDEGKMILVEDYIDGIEVAVEGLIVNREFVPLTIFDKPEPLKGPFFEETIYVTPSKLSQSIQKKILKETKNASNAIQLTNGPIHAELRIDSNDNPWIIDIASRTIGGKCSRVIKFLDEISLESIILSHIMGEKIPKIVPMSSSSGVMMIPIPKSGILKEVKGKEEGLKIKGIEEIEITIPLGEKIVQLPEGDRYLGFIFATSDEQENTIKTLKEAHGKMEFTIQ